MTNSVVAGNGIDIALTVGQGTVIGVHMDNMIMHNWKNAFKHTSGHVNNFYINKCDFSYNYDNGFVVDSDTVAGQANWFTLIDCGADNNGYDNSGGTLLEYTQPDINNPNYNKGVGFKINGTAHFLRIGGHLNKTAGILIPNKYTLGCNITGYFEGSTIGDLVVLAISDLVKDTIINIYSSGQKYVFTEEKVKRIVMPYVYGLYNEDLAKKQWSNNIIAAGKAPVLASTNANVTRTINANGEAEFSILGSVTGTQYIYLPTDPIYKYKGGDMFQLSADVFISANGVNDIEIGLGLGAGGFSTALLRMGGQTPATGVWVRKTTFVTIPSTVAERTLQVYIRRYSETIDFKVRNVSIQKFETAGETFSTNRRALKLTAPVPTTQTAAYVQADVQSISTRLENLIQNLKDADILSTL